jgi:hypothetical protein
MATGFQAIDGVPRAETVAPSTGIRGYFATLLGALLLPIAAVFAFNLGVDPLLYRWPRMAWQPQPAFLPYDREVHYNLIAHARPRALLLGNSQTQHGIRPADWAVPGPVINAGMVSADIPELRRSLQIAQAGGPVERAILGLDFTMSRGRVGPAPQVQEDFVLAPDGTMRLANLRGLFSFTLLRASSIALLNRYHHHHHTTFALGGEALDALYTDSVRDHGGTLGALAGRLAQFEQNVRAPAIDFTGQLRGLRDQACSGGTRLTVYLTPIHATWILALDDVGQAEAWEAWKRAVVQVAGERRDCTFDVWDFNTFNPVTTEALPAPGAAGGLNASWDGVHFKPWVGARILARMAATGDDPAGFGVRLTPATIDAALARDRDAEIRYRRAHPTAPTPTDILQMHAIGVH